MPGLFERDFIAERVNRKWVGDFKKNRGWKPSGSSPALLREVPSTLREVRSAGLHEWRCGHVKVA